MRSSSASAELEAYLGVIERHSISFFLLATVIIAVLLALTAHLWR